MSLRRTKRNWEQFARRSPLWAICTSRATWDFDDFFRSGESQVTEILGQIADRGIDVPRGRCLDFGCGVGRLTQALATRFAMTDGVDIARPMIEQARRYNRHPEHCRYEVNTAPDLRRYADGTFDFVFSLYVLQHIPPAHARRYLSELVRVLRPGGVAFFQVPGARRQRTAVALPPEAYRAAIRSSDTTRVPVLRIGGSRVLSLLRGRLGKLRGRLGRLRRRLARLRRRLGRLRGAPVMEMHCLPPEEVGEIVAGAGGRVLARWPQDDAEPDFDSFRYVACRA